MPIPRPVEPLRTSIAMATCNGARHLGPQLQSIAAQTTPPAELVVCDDRSDDATVAMLRQFAGHVSFPVRIVENAERLGYRRNFAQAAALCTGDLIAFCDQDDVWHPDKIAHSAAAFDDPGITLAYHGALVVDAQDQPRHRMYTADTERGTLDQLPPHPWHYSFGLVQTFRAELRAFDHLWPGSVDQNTGCDILAHDQWYFFLALTLGRVVFVDEDLVRYRQHGANTYGANPARGLWQRIRYRLIHHAESDAAAAAGAESRAAVLHAIADSANDPDTPRAAAGRYADLAARLTRRHATYTRGRAADRLISLVASLRAGDYRGNPWAFDPRSIARDLWSGVYSQSR